MKKNPGILVNLGKFILISFLILIGVPFITMGLFMYGFLPFPPERTQKIYLLDNGGKVELRGTKEQGWGSDGYLWEGKYFPPHRAKSESLQNWLSYLEPNEQLNQIKIFLSDGQVIVIQDSQHYQKRISGGKEPARWKTFSCRESPCSLEQFSRN